MGKRRKAREVTLQVLYESEFSEVGWEEILSERVARRSSTKETSDYAQLLIAKTVDNLEDLDEKIKSSLQNWEFDRISIVDKNILRFALAEIMFFPDVPSNVILNEAIEIAHKYSSHDAGKFVNGILDRLLQELRRGEA